MPSITRSILPVLEKVVFLAAGALVGVISKGDDMTLTLWLVLGALVCFAIGIEVVKYRLAKADWKREQATKSLVRCEDCGDSVDRADCEESIDGDGRPAWRHKHRMCRGRPHDWPKKPPEAATPTGSGSP